MKSEQELNILKEEVEPVSRELHELTVEELSQVSGGVDSSSGRTCTIINCDAVNIRNATNNGDIIGTIPQGKKVAFIQKVGNWGLVEYRGIRGYIWHEYYRLN